MYCRIAAIVLIAAVIPGCIHYQGEIIITPSPTKPVAKSKSLTGTTSPTAKTQPPPVNVFSKYAFPATTDPGRQYLFYIHGRIIEEQGIPAISPEFGEYDIGAILDKLSRYGFVVISEQRPKNAEPMAYARKFAGQVSELLDAGVPAKNITLVGASKGGYIAILTSNILQNQELKFVIMAICNPETLEDLKLQQVFLYGDVLSIYDSVDPFGGSCEGLLPNTGDKRQSRYEELVLEVGSGHGILYKPMKEWIIPVVEWARGDGR
jgi:hypothetical protein